MKKSNLWLVKSSGKIMGPFSFDDIVTKLKSRQLVLLDELAAPESHWKFVRDQVPFARVVEELRTRNDRSHQQTQTGTDTIANNEFTQSLTGPISDLSDELTPVHERTDPAYRRRPQSSSDAPVVYGLAQDVLVQKQIQKQSSSSWKIILVVAVVLALGVVLSKDLWTQKGRLQNMRVDHLSLGKEAIASGNVRLAFEHFEQSIQNDNPSDEIKLLSSLFALQFPGDTVVIRRRIQSLSPAAQNEKEKFLVTALADINDERYSDAASQLQRAVSAPTSSPSLKQNKQVATNMALVSYLKSDFNQVLQTLPSPGFEPIPLALYAMATMKLSETSKIREYETLDARLRNFINTQSNWVLELSLLRAYIMAKGSQEQAADYVMGTVLNIDPQATDLHWQDPWVAYSAVRQRIYTEWCPRLADKLTGQMAGKAILALCNLRTAKPQLAQKNIEEALNLAPKDTLINAWYGFIFQETGLESKANEHLALSEESNEKLGKNIFSLPLILKARKLEEGQDFSAAHQIWTRLSSLSNSSIQALVGRARYLFESGNTEQAKLLVREAVKISPDYRPLLQLMADLKKKEK